MSPAKEDPPILDQPESKKTRVTQRNLPKFIKKQQYDFAPELLENAFKALVERSKSNDMKAVGIILDMFGLVQKNPSVVVNNSNQMANMGQSPTMGGQRTAVGFENILRKIKEGRGEAPALPAATKMLETTIIDAEVVDSPTSALFGDED